MAIQDTIRQRAAEAYFGGPEGAQAATGSPFLDIILALFKSLLSGICPAGIAHAQANGNHRQQARARRRIAWEAASMTDDSNEVNRITDATMTVAQQTTLAEAEEFAAS